MDDENADNNTFAYGISRVLQPHAAVGIYSAEPGSVVLRRDWDFKEQGTD